MNIKTRITIRNPDYKAEIITYVRILPMSDKYKNEIVATEFIDVVLPICVWVRHPMKQYNFLPVYLVGRGSA